MAKKYKKDPSATLDYGFRWTTWLAGDIIVDSSWTVPAGITVVSESFTTEATTIWVTGGTLGESYTLVNHVETNSSPAREDDRTIIITIAEK